MKKSLMLLLMLLLSLGLMYSCGSDDETTDGDTDGDVVVDGDGTVDGDAVVDGDNVVEDGDDVVDGDQPFTCSGTCTANDSTCMGDDVCYCENGTWKTYTCTDVCAADGGKVSKGCGANADMGGKDYCLCELETVDGDDDTDTVNPDCSGSCDANFELKCTGANSLCTCNETSLEQEEVNCNTICVDAGYDGSQGCEENPQTGMDVCMCFEQGCTSDQDCISEGKDICVTMGDNSFCVDECAMNTCSATVGCMDAGIGDDCGICFDLQNANACDTDGATCETDKLCTSVCGLYPNAPVCVQTCEAAPSTCAADETCLPLATDAQGTIGSGACIAFSDLNCDTCGEQQATDGDVDGDEEVADGDEEVADGDEEAAVE